MKKIVIILICLTIPIQISMIMGIAVHTAPFCYYYHDPPNERGEASVQPLYFQCSWEIDAFFKSYNVLPVTIITMPIVLNVFLIHFVKNYKRV